MNVKIIKEEVTESGSFLRGPRRSEERLTIESLNVGECAVFTYDEEDTYKLKSKVLKSTIIL